ncbi:DNA repair protein [Siphonobacter sp. BAB-5405]|uniref:JAB domain-containing protein n=1 Tax=Siphonobacter sp. BAB-5405 TaxID=1864825 RepID=UPI000C80A6B9|nr:JAB domain-containing protein [Siphonobacter sp. BAB-5405]PMD95689.1 DNA repair protein [Siphonobacter sp. BAB-5405]
MTSEALDLTSLLKVNEVELVYRNPIPYERRLQVCSSQAAYYILRQTWNENRIELVEEFRILLLNQQNHCLGVSTISSGGLASCLADPRLIFATALKAGATSLIVAHNHPSGNLTPSYADKTLTTKLQEGGRILDIAILDHLIITPQHYRSLADEGLLP